MNEEFQRLMQVREDQVDDEIVEIVLRKIFLARENGVGSVNAMLWYNSEFRLDEHEYKDFLNELGLFGRFSFGEGVESFEVCERNGQTQGKLSVSVLVAVLPMLEITIIDPENPHNVRRIMIQGKENVLSFLEKFSHRLHV